MSSMGFVYPLPYMLRVMIVRIAFRLFFVMVGVATFSYSQWAYGIGPSGTGSNRPYAVSVDGSGNIYLTGYFILTTNFNPGGTATNLTSVGSNDIFIAKYSSSGLLTWVQQIGGTLSDKGYAITTDFNHNVFVTGLFTGTVDFDPGAGTTSLNSTNGHIFVAKYNSSGSLLWAKNFGGTNANNVPHAIGLTSGGDVYVVGEFYGTTNFSTTGTTNLVSAGQSDVFVAKFSASDGSTSLAYNVGGTDYDECYGIAIDGIDNLYIAGRFKSTADFDPSISTSNLTSAGGYDVFLAYYDFSGAYQGAIRLGSTSDDEAKSIALTADDNIVMTGDFSGTVDFNPGAGVANLTPAADEGIFFGKYDLSLQYIWAKVISAGSGTPTATCYSNQITSDASNNVYLIGNYINNLNVDPNGGSTILGAGSNAFFAKYSSSGSLSWGKLISASNTDGYGIAVDGSNNVIVTGDFQGNCDLDPDAGVQSVSSSGTFDIFLAKYTTSGSLPVELREFTANLINNSVELRWTTATEHDNYGFEVQKKSSGTDRHSNNENNTWRTIGFIEGHGTTNTNHDYFFWDKQNQGSVSYRLKQLDHQGATTFSQIIAINQFPNRFELLPNYPNPFNPSTTISYGVPFPSRISLKIYNEIGQQIDDLVESEEQSGWHDVIWNPKISSGIYYYRIEAVGISDPNQRINVIKKMTLLK